eukprot:TRINITY_DN7854_c0_g1_i1.p1 TRINITY_DN7854_c0_g1~~TRINITY_DN7854_c0_g1_i1.p1  ORF type:complete len:435 (+),score=90.64 TRINITY_DN7854_c0_g1_i1:99-1307(+)
MADPVTAMPNEYHFNAYNSWSQTGAGLLITGNVMIDGRYREAPSNVVVEDSKYCDIELLKQWAESATTAGNQCWVQISHSGRQCPISVNRTPVGPSEVQAVKQALPVFGKPRALTVDQIRDIVDRFVYTALTVKECGFDGIQIHSAHGYLLSQFLSAYTNKRCDDYGGCADNRRRLLEEVVTAVRAAVGDDYPIGVKINSADFQKGGFTEEESADVIHMLTQLNVDLIEISGGNYENVVFVDTISGPREAYFIDFVDKIRELSNNVPILLTGGFRTAKIMNESIQNGSVDLIGIARPFASNPENIRKLIDGELDVLPEIRPYMPIRSFSSSVNTLWHVRNIHRIGGNLELEEKVTMGSYLWIFTIGMIFCYIWNPRLANGKTNVTLSLVFMAFIYFILNIIF